MSWALKKSSQFNISLPFAWCLVQTLYRGMTGRFSHHNSDKEERRDKGFTKQFFPSFYVCILLRYEEYKISGIIRPQFCDRMFPVFVRHLISDLISAVLHSSSSRNNSQFLSLLSRTFKRFTTTLTIINRRITLKLVEILKFM